MTSRFSSVTLTTAFLLGLMVLHNSYWSSWVDSDFHLIFKYGVGGKNVLNTFTGSYTKDMVCDPPTAIKMCLTREELDRIYRKMGEIDFFSYPKYFHPPLEGDVIGEQTPFSTYYFKVQYNSAKLKELHWNDRYLYPGNEKVEDLKELIDLIREIIESKPEYQRLPKPRARYL